MCCRRGAPTDIRPTSEREPACSTHPAPPFTDNPHPSYKHGAQACHVKVNGKCLIEALICCNFLHVISGVTELKFQIERICESCITRMKLTKIDINLQGWHVANETCLHIFNLECAQFSSFPLQSTSVVNFSSYKLNYLYCLCLMQLCFDLV